MNFPQKCLLIRNLSVGSENYTYNLTNWFDSLIVGHRIICPPTVSVLSVLSCLQELTLKFLDSFLCFMVIFIGFKQVSQGFVPEFLVKLIF